MIYFRKKYKNIIFLQIVILFITMFTGCENLITDENLINKEPKPISLADSRFNGRFVYSCYWVDGVEENKEYTSFTFDGTNKAAYYTKYQAYYISIGWLYSGDYIGDSYRWDFEFEVSNGKYRMKLWNNSFSEWHDWEPYEFTNDGNTLTLYNYYNLSDNNKVFTKDSSKSVKSSIPQIKEVDLLKSFHDDRDKNKLLHMNSQ